MEVEWHATTLLELEPAASALEELSERMFALLEGMSTL